MEAVLPEGAREMREKEGSILYLILIFIPVDLPVVSSSN